MTARREIERLIRTAHRLGVDHYARAIAAQIEGKDSRYHWLRFRMLFARTWLLGQLTGLARAYDRAAHQGADLIFDAGDVTPERFDRAEPPGDPWGLVAGEDDDFILGEFREAIQAFDHRIPMLRAKVKPLAEKAKRLANQVVKYEATAGYDSIIGKSRAAQEALSRAFWVSDVDLDTTVNLKKLVADAIRGDVGGKGMTLPDFIDRAHLAGARDLTSARLETVLRNNTMAAYNEGTAAALEAPEVTEFFPLMMLEEIRDKRTRGNPAGLYPDRGVHWQMDGYVNTLAEFKRLGIVPPNGHQCRATLREMTRYESKGLGLLNEDGSVNAGAVAKHNGQRQQLIESGQYPDTGFGAVA